MRIQSLSSGPRPDAEGPAAAVRRPPCMRHERQLRPAGRRRRGAQARPWGDGRPLRRRSGTGAAHPVGHGLGGAVCRRRCGAAGLHRRGVPSGLRQRVRRPDRLTGSGGGSLPAGADAPHPAAAGSRHGLCPGPTAGGGGAGRSPADALPPQRHSGHRVPEGPAAAEGSHGAAGRPASGCRPRRRTLRRHGLRLLSAGAAALRPYRRGSLLPPCSCGAGAAAGAGAGTGPGRPLLLPPGHFSPAAAAAGGGLPPL